MAQKKQERVKEIVSFLKSCKDEASKSGQKGCPNSIQSICKAFSVKGKRCQHVIKTQKQKFEACTKRVKSKSKKEDGFIKKMAGCMFGRRHGGKRGNRRNRSG